jgi:hypothetical protein
MQDGWALLASRDSPYLDELVVLGVLQKKAYANGDRSYVTRPKETWPNDGRSDQRAWARAELDLAHALAMKVLPKIAAMLAAFDVDQPLDDGWRVIFRNSDGVATGYLDPAFTTRAQAEARLAEVQAEALGA